MRPTLALVLTFAACSSPDPDAQALADQQLESASVVSPACTDGVCDGSDLATGALAVTRSAGASSVELELTVDAVTAAVHSPTGVDLSAFDGTEVTLAVRSDWMVPASLALRDAEGVVYVVESGQGDAFGVFDVQYGKELGRLVDDADYELTFRALDVATDDGVVSVEPGEVVTVRVDGASWRFAAIAAYEVGTIPGGEYADCGGEAPMASYEAVRLPEEAAFDPIVRPAGLPMALYSGCGG